jgi:hypothetical protein
MESEGKMATFYTNFATKIGRMAAIESDHFQNDSKPYNKRIDVFLRQSEFIFVYVM